MTRKADLGGLIAWLSGGAIVAAVVAGLLVVGNPMDARALRLDGKRLDSMGDVAAAAQCAYSFSGKVPASTEEIRLAFRERRRDIPACNAVQSQPLAEAGVVYAADGPEHIKLCADFLRPTGETPTGETREIVVEPSYGRAGFAELREERAAAGRHCFRVRLVRQTPGSGED